jgi:Ca-activated chloride channel family protein
MLEFAWPLAALAIALPWLVARYIPAAAPFASSLRVPFLREARDWQAAAGGARPRLRRGLALAAFAALVAAACRPQWVGDPVNWSPSGRSMLLALDLSGSMRGVVAGTDVGLDAVRHTARRFIAGRTGDRIGLIVFGTRAHLQAPPTFDLRALADMVDETFIGLAGEGTALGDAIALSVARLRTMQSDERVLILLTDGSSTEGTVDMTDAANLARYNGVRVHSIGIGAPLADNAQRTGDGLDERALKLVAERTGGRYFRAETSDSLKRIYEALDRYEPAARDQRRYEERIELYAWPLGLALALALAAFAARIVPLRVRRA